MHIGYDLIHIYIYKQIHTDTHPYKHKPAYIFVHKNINLY
mgnify:CR=1 FL=1